MKKIAILTCLNATKICSGVACFNALNNRKGHFSCYKGEDIQIVADFHCNGCQANYEVDEAYLEKINLVCEIQPDAVHIGQCTIINGQECKTITRMAKRLEQSNIKVIRGTH